MVKSNIGVEAAVRMADPRRGPFQVILVSVNAPLCFVCVSLQVTRGQCLVMGVRACDHVIAVVTVRSCV